MQVPALVDYYDSAEEAIDKLVNLYYIYQFDNQQEYFAWLISVLQGKLSITQNDPLIKFR